MGATHAAFLRAINVGGRRLDMAALRGHVGALGWDDVATVLATGTVVFAAPGGTSDELEAQLSAHLTEALGYPVPAMVRTAAEVRALVAVDPFPGEAAEGDALHVGFLSGEPSPSARDEALAMATEDDLLAVEGRDLLWLRRGSFMDATIDIAAVSRTLRVEVTVRTIGTVRKVAAKLAG